jgi:cytochrome c biogenesis protein
MFILIVLGLIGTFVIQVPAESAGNLAGYHLWLENVAQPQTGFWYPVLSYTGLFDVFHSPWFLGAGALLIVNIIICSLNRFRRMRVNSSLSTTKESEGFYKTEAERIELSAISINAEAVRLLTEMLKKHHYSIRTKNVSDDIYLVADKNRYSPLGTYLIHLSIVLLIAGFLIGSFLGFRDNSLIVTEGATQDIGYNTGLSLHLNSFVDEYWPDGSPKDYRSDIVLYKNNREVEKGIIWVNHPLNYQGVRIYQSFFGPAVQMQIRDSSGKILFRGNIALDETFEDHPYRRPLGVLSLTQEGYVLYIMGQSTTVKDNILENGQIGLGVYKIGSSVSLFSAKIDQGTTYSAENLEFTYLQNARFSGFQVSKDPGSNLIWTASGLFILGLILVFYFPRRRLWGFIQANPEKGYNLWLRSGPERKFGLTSEFQNLVKEIKHKLASKQNTN